MISVLYKELHYVSENTLEGDDLSGYKTTRGFFVCRWEDRMNYKPESHTVQIEFSTRMEANCFLAWLESVGEAEYRKGMSQPDRKFVYDPDQLMAINVIKLPESVLDEVYEGNIEGVKCCDNCQTHPCPVLSAKDCICQDFKHWTPKRVGQL